MGIDARARDAGPPPDEWVQLLAALAETTRLRIVRLLRGGPMTVGVIAHALGQPVVNVSHHLNRLSDADVLVAAKEGRFVRYALNPDIWDPADGSLTAAGLRVELPPA